jgi:hypothetical protein
MKWFKAQEKKMKWFRIRMCEKRERERERERELFFMIILSIG